MATALQDVINASRSSASPLAAANATEIQDRFLKLLVTQLKHQDPLKPMDNAQITTQLSQISTVSGIDKLNDTVAGLATALAVSQTMNSAAMIGREVLAPGATLTLANKRAAGAIELKEPADRVSLTIVGPAGDIVRRLELGPSATGLHAFAWDGTTENGAVVKDGSYAYRVEAARGGKPLSASQYTVGAVTGIGVSGKDPTIVVNGGSEVRFADVKRIQ